MALPNGIQSHDELLEAQAHVWSHILSFINSMSLKCAIQLGVPDTIHNHGKPMKLSELVKAIPINGAKSECIYRLMRVLVHSKFFRKIRNLDEGEEEGYWLTTASCLLLRDDPLSVAPFALFVLDTTLTDPWHHVCRWFQNNENSVFFTAHGATFVEHAGKSPRINKLFYEGMASDARLVNQVLVEKCQHVFEGLKSMVDVGGSTKIVSKDIANACPGLKCVVLELPHVIVDLQDSESLNFVVGDMFESIPQADAVFLKWILHDWSEEECVKILKKCKEAIPSKGGVGKVIIVDMIVDDEKADKGAVEAQILFDMEMMILTTGKERTEKEWAKLFVDSGFTSYKVTHVLGLRSLIEIFP